MGFSSGKDKLTDLEVDTGVISVDTDSAHPAPAVRANGPILGTMALNVVDTNDNLTITVAQLIGAALARGSGDELSAHRTDITPTAAQIVAAIPGCVVSQRFNFKYCNFDSSHNIILDLGTGVTNHVGSASATYTVAPGKARNFLFRVTNVTADSEAVSIIADGAAYTIS